MKRSVFLAISAVVASAAAIFAPAAAHALPLNWSTAQAVIGPVSLHQPTDLVGLTWKSLSTDMCGPTSATAIVAKYTKGIKKLRLLESSSQCGVVGSGYAAVPSLDFPIENGAGTAHVYARCVPDLACEFPTKDSIAYHGAMIMFTMHSSKAMAQPPKVTIYANRVKYEKLRMFVWGLAIVN